MPKLSNNNYLDIAKTPSIRQQAFEALSDLERLHPLRVLSASIEPSRQDNESVVYFNAVPLENRTLSEQAVNQWLLESNKNKEHFITYSVSSARIRQPLYTSLISMAVLSPPLITSPTRIEEHLTTYWGEPLPLQVRQSLGLNLLRSAASAQLTLRHNQGAGPRILDNISRGNLSDVILNTSVVIYNAMTALGKAEWSPWTIPSDVSTSLSMLRDSGMPISINDMNTLKSVTSEDFNGAGDEAVSEAEKLSRLVRHAIKRYFRSISALVTEHFESGSINPNDADSFLARESHGFIQSSIIGRGLSAYSSDSASHATVDLLHERTYAYRYKSHIEPMPDVQNELEIFSF